jgi:hypothetical protein
LCPAVKQSSHLQTWTESWGFSAQAPFAMRFVNLRESITPPRMRIWNADVDADVGAVVPYCEKRTARWTTR